ncbi:hypothetical protein R3P38DRAFT_2793637 [Favolaschia claudopus]|uniref:Uncharacterized protein n=1 Tax=Favolaschia claudopus TaxID=2862362 RepID=A0AAW0ADM3_9AGAR
MSKNSHKISEKSSKIRDFFAPNLFLPPPEHRLMYSGWLDYIVFGSETMQNLANFAHPVDISVSSCCFSFILASNALKMLGEGVTALQGGLRNPKFEYLGHASQAGRIDRNERRISSRVLFPNRYMHCQAESTSRS